MDNLSLWNAVKQPPASALKTIKGGRLSGMTDIKPVWRFLALTEQFGPCGMGWKYTIDKLWPETGSDGQIFAFASVSLSIKVDGEWSEPIPGIGGSMLVTKESAGLHSSDEGYKMAVTDALGVACRSLGVAADVYAGRWDGSKFNAPEGEPVEYITEKQLSQIVDMANESGTDAGKFLKYMNAKSLETIPASQFKKAMKALGDKLKAKQAKDKADAGDN